MPCSILRRSLRRPPRPNRAGRERRPGPLPKRLRPLKRLEARRFLYHQLLGVWDPLERRDRMEAQTVDEYIRGLPPEQAEVASALRATARPQGPAGRRGKKRDEVRRVYQRRGHQEERTGL